MFPHQTTESLIQRLQRYRREAEANRRFSGGKQGNTFLPLFAKYPADVQAVCWKHLNALCHKHKERLEANYGRYYGVLVATATRMALDETGLHKISQKGFRRFRAINNVQQQLGMRDKHPSRRYIKGYGKNKVNKDAAPKANMQKLNVSQLPLQC